MTRKEYMTLLIKAKQLAKQQQLKNKTMQPVLKPIKKEHQDMIDKLRRESEAAAQEMLNLPKSLESLMEAMRALKADKIKNGYD
jgi:NifU-like protein involved in Fe-S cluster formation